jgi:hypothetical protein
MKGELLKVQEELTRLRE